MTVSPSFLGVYTYFFTRGRRRASGSQPLEPVPIPDNPFHLVPTRRDLGRPTGGAKGLLYGAGSEVTDGRSLTLQNTSVCPAWVRSQNPSCAR